MSLFFKDIFLDFNYEEIFPPYFPGICYLDRLQLSQCRDSIHSGKNALCACLEVHRNR